METGEYQRSSPDPHNGSRSDGRHRGGYSVVSYQAADRRSSRYCLLDCADSNRQRNACQAPQRHLLRQ